VSAHTFTDITIRKPARSPVLTTVRTAVRDSSPAPARTAVEFSDFVATQYRALLGTAYLLTRDRGLAEDLVQTALAKCWTSWHRIESDEPDAYVRRVLVNTFRGTWRLKRGKREYSTDVLPEIPRSGEPTDYETSDRRAALLTALALLPRRMRRMVVLRYFEDLTEAATADALGCSIGNVKSQTSRALTKLRQDPALTDLWLPNA
jgi:RNA polymerase sigma-70 factor (sigma-E family)